MDVVFEYCWPNSVEIETSKPEVRAGVDELNEWFLACFMQEHPELARRTGTA